MLLSHGGIAISGFLCPFKNIFTNYKNKPAKRGSMRRISYQPVIKLKDSFFEIFRKWPLSLLVIAIDFAFLTVFSFVYTLFFQNIMGHASIIMEQSPVMTSAMQQQDIYNAAQIAQELSNQVTQIKNLAFILAISSLVIWIAFQAVNWMLCFKISGRKVKYLDYIKPFAILSAIWTAIVSVILYVSIQMFFGQALAFSSTPSPNEGILSVGIIIAFAIVSYFALISFSLTGRVRDVLKKTVTTSFLNLKAFVSYVFLLAIIAIIDLIVTLLWKINSTMTIIIGAILMLLFFVFARIYMINVVQEIANKKK